MHECAYLKLRLTSNLKEHEENKSTYLETNQVNRSQSRIFSSPEPKAHWRAYRIGRPPSSTLFKYLRNPLANQSQISYSPWDGGTKVCSNGPGHMTKMAAMPIYSKNLKKSSPPEPKGR